MSERSWNQLVEEANVAGTGDYVDRGVLWMQEQNTALIHAVKAAYALGHKHANLPQGSREVLDTDNEVLAEILGLEYEEGP